MTTAASADDLTPTSYSEAMANIGGPSNIYSLEQSYDLSANLSASVAGSSSVLSLNPVVPALEVSGNSSDYYTYTYSYINFNYAYQVENASGLVPVDVSYKLEAQDTVGAASASASATAAIQVTQQQYPSGPYNTDTFYNADAYTGSTAPTVVGTFLTSATPNVANLIYLSVNEMTASGNSATSTAEAYADPLIYIDPAYLAANPGVTLQISPGVGNVGPSSATPEPQSWALMIAGVGMIGGAFRHRRKLKVAATA